MDIYLSIYIYIFSLISHQSLRLPSKSVLQISSGPVSDRGTFLRRTVRAVRLNQWRSFPGFSTLLEGLTYNLPSGKHTKNYGKSPFLMGKSTISMAIFHSYVSLPEGTTMTIPIAPTVTFQVMQKIHKNPRCWEAPGPKNHQTRARSQTGAPLMGLKHLPQKPFFLYWG